MLLIHPQFVISQPLNSATVLKSPLASWWNHSSPATELERTPVSLYLYTQSLQSVINCSKEIFNVCFLFFILKNSPVFNNYWTSIPITWGCHHYAWKYGVVLCVMCCICPKHNTLYSGQKVNCFATFLLQYYFSALLQTGCMFWNIFILYKLPSFHYVN